MTKTLIIMRHAKSSWSSPGLDDFDRPLNKRGRASAKALGDWLSFGGFKPDLVLASSSARTRETWERTGLQAQAEFRKELYLASSADYLQAVRNAECSCLLLLGHNPGIGNFAARIVAEDPSHERFLDYPTGATLVADIEGEWRDLTFGNANARAFTVPRDLMSDP